MTQPARNSYDVVPYLDRSHYSTHPDRMATIGRLLGLEPAPVEQARVLELGCANGANLLPMAANLPGSTFVGVDYSARQIAKGQAALAELGLTNMTLRHASILDVDAGLGQFDYIIAHGVFSWVPPEVQDKIYALGMVPSHLGPAALRALLLDQYKRWEQPVKASGFKPE